MCRGAEVERVGNCVCVLLTVGGGEFMKLIAW